MKEKLERHLYMNLFEAKKDSSVTSYIQEEHLELLIKNSLWNVRPKIKVSDRYFLNAFAYKNTIKNKMHLSVSLYYVSDVISSIQIQTENDFSISMINKTDNDLFESRLNKIPIRYQKFLMKHLHLFLWSIYFYLSF